MYGSSISCFLCFRYPGFRLTERFCNSEMGGKGSRAQKSSKLADRLHGSMLHHTLTFFVGDTSQIVRVASVCKRWRTATLENEGTLYSGKRFPVSPPCFSLVRLTACLTASIVCDFRLPPHPPVDVVISIVRRA